MDLIGFLLIGVVAGWLGGKIMKGGGYGLLGNMVVGVVGSFLGGWALGLAGISFGGTVGALATATIGAVLLLFIVGLIKK